MRFDPETLSKLDVDKFTLEDAMRAFHMWRWTCRIALNTGIRQGKFAKDGEFYKLIDDN